MAGRIKAALAGLGLFILAMLAAFQRGRRQGRADAQAGVDQARLKTIERINDAKQAAAADGAGWAERLRRTRR